MALLVLLAGLEWARLCRLAAWSTWVYAGALGALVLALPHAGVQRELFVLAALFWAVVAPLWMWRGLRPQEATWIGAAGFAVLVPAGVAMTALAPLEILLVLVLVWIADTTAYFVGRAWGRRKLAPSISPGKSWEGAIGGLIGASLYAIILGFYTQQGAWLALVATALLIGMASIVGDLFESAAKRQAGVKDSGALLPGHGGILDRIDAILITSPAAYYFLRIFV